MSKLALQLINENIEKHKRGEDSRSLDLGKCGMTEVPEEIGELVWLEELILSDEWSEYILEKKYWDSKSSQNKGEVNKVINLPHSLPNLLLLKKIVFASTEVGDLSLISRLTNLQILNCYSTRVSDLSPIAGLANLQELYCRSTLINNLNPISGLTNLQQLYCDSRQVSDLSPIAGLTNLQKINCSNTQVSDLDPISRLTNLQQLYCHSLQISNLSPVAGLTNLQILNCHSTQISDLSPIAGLTNLQLLSCHSTQISDLSPIAGLTNLEDLDCHSTQISDLSPIAALTNLEELNCSYTQTSDLSPILPLIKSGRQVKWNEYGGDIQVKDCPLVHPPVEIVKQGNEAILQYFEEIEHAKKTSSVIRLAEAKCLILGEGGAGKTSLTRKLLNSNNPLPEEKETTKGIAVYPYDLTLPDGTEFRLNIWDFGGQEIYHATHQFFLTKRSLYLLLDDTRKDEKTVHDPIFNYWLQVAELYGGGSPLLIVQNEKGDRSKELDLKSMQSRFGFVKDAKATNLLTCRDLDKVWEAIAYWLKQLPHIGEEQPKAWLDIRRELERLAQEDKRDHISLETYYDICSKHDIPETKRALFLSGYLHDFGAFLHFQDHPLLRKTLVLNNQWATDAVYKVLDCESVKKSFGRFTKQVLSDIWADDRYSEQHAELLALMEKFELCYKLPDEKKDTWLAPQLLSVKQPDELDWDETANLQVRYEYEFMPKGLLSQHIVRMHRYILQPDLAWKSGVVFERAGSQALVTEAWGSRKISLRAKGPQAKELLTLLCEDFDKMHERLEGLRAKKMIPCNCNVCGKATDPHFYEFADLARRKGLGKQTVECKVSFEDVSVMGLLDGVFVKEITERPEDKKQALKTIKIFLASSEELLQDRDQFEIFISRENDYLFEKGVRIQLVRWENFLDAVSASRLQEEYNKVLCTCDLVVCLFHTKVGKYTAEEFDVALGQFRGTGAPKIFTYFKDEPVKPSQIRDNSVNEFKENLGKIGHFYTTYESLGDLKHHFGEQLKKLNISL